MAKDTVIQDTEIEEARLANAKAIEQAKKTGEEPAPPPELPAVVAPVETVDPTGMSDAELDREIRRYKNSMIGLKGVDKKLFNEIKTELERMCQERDERAAEEKAEELREKAARNPVSAGEKAAYAAKLNAAEKAEADAKLKRAEAERVKKAK